MLRHPSCTLVSLQGSVFRVFCGSGIEGEQPKLSPWNVSVVHLFISRLTVTPAHARSHLAQVAPRRPPPCVREQLPVVKYKGRHTGQSFVLVAKQW